MKAIGEFTKASNFLYLFIASIIVGSIFGMDRQVLIKGFLKIFVPLAAGSVVGGTIGTLVGIILGIGAYHSFSAATGQLAIREGRLGRVLINGPMFAKPPR